MNLLKDQWLPVIRLDKTREIIAIWQLLDNYKINPVVDLEAPRPDLRNALYQLILGIIQVAAMPEDEELWGDLWQEPYHSEEFKEKLLKYANCFEIDSDGPAFMQDYKLDKYVEENLTNIFMDLPGNLHFNKFVPKKVDIYWAAISLYSLQTFGPAGGRGQRTGLRGGGPITTLLLPVSEEGSVFSFWCKLWLNIFSEETLDGFTGNLSLSGIENIFPWMKKTKISIGAGTGLFPQECHPFQMYFGMPRRIRLIFSDESNICDLTGIESGNIVSGYKTYHSGNNYDGVWQHPLTPYRKNPKNPDEPPYSVKGNPGGITYKHWLRLAFGFGTNTDIPAKNLSLCRSSNERIRILKKNKIIVWACGYDLNNIKARSWYETSLPVFNISIDNANKIENKVNIFIFTADKIMFAIRLAIKEAWYKNPKEAKGDFSFIDNSFMQNTESRFYNLLEQITYNIEDTEIISKCGKEWSLIIRQEAENLFDKWALSNQDAGVDMQRIVKARNGLQGKIYNATQKGDLYNLINQEQED